MLSERQIFYHWLPLLTIWFLMALDLGIASSLVARDSNAEVNLAAFNITFALALLLESPIIMILVVPIKLVKGKHSLHILRRYSCYLNGALTVLILLLLIPQVFEIWALNLLSIDQEVTDLVYRCLWFYIPWSGMIGYRRFYQGMIVKARQNYKIVYGTVVRLVSLAFFSYLLLKTSPWSSAESVSLSLNIAVVLEAFTVRYFAREAVAKFSSIEDDSKLSFKKINQFYFPLVLTALLSLSVQPLANLSASYGADPIRSLAVLPVINAFVFLFKAIAISYQEVVLSLLADSKENFNNLMAVVLKILAFIGITYSAIVFTPLGNFWFQNLAGLSPELTALTLPAVRVMIFMPLLAVAFSWQRSLLIYEGHTRYIGYASVFEIFIISSLLFLFIIYGKQATVMSIMYSLIIGRGLSTLYLMSLRRRETRRSLKEAEA